MATTFQLESMDSKLAVVSFACVGEPRRRYTVDFADAGLPGAIRARCEDGSVATLGGFRIDSDTPHPGYMRLRNRVAQLRAGS